MKKTKAVPVSVAACAMQDHLLRQVHLLLLSLCMPHSFRRFSAVAASKHGPGIQPQEEPPSSLRCRHLRHEHVLLPAAAAQACRRPRAEGPRSRQSARRTHACSEVSCCDSSFSHCANGCISQTRFSRGATPSADAAGVLQSVPPRPPTPFHSTALAGCHIFCCRNGKLRRKKRATVTIARYPALSARSTSSTTTRFLRWLRCSHMRTTPAACVCSATMATMTLICCRSFSVAVTFFMRLASDLSSDSADARRAPSVAAGTIKRKGPGPAKSCSAKEAFCCCSACCDVRVHGEYCATCKTRLCPKTRTRGRSFGLSASASSQTRC